jgi:hypothetical protein
MIPGAPTPLTKPVAVEVADAYYDGSMPRVAEIAYERSEPPATPSPVGVHRLRFAGAAERHVPDAVEVDQVSKHQVGIQYYKTALALAVVISAISIAHAETSVIQQATVTRTLVDGNHYGHCMATLDVDPQSKLPTCGSRWISLSCDGTFTDRATAFRMYDQFMYAMAADKKVTVFFTDEQKHNGYCVAYRVDVLR